MLLQGIISNELEVVNVDYNSFDGYVSFELWEPVTRDSLPVKVYHDCIKTNMFSCGMFSRKTRPGYVKLIKAVGYLFEHEQEVIDACWEGLK